MPIRVNMRQEATMIIFNLLCNLKEVESTKKSDPDLSRNAIDYRDNHKYRDDNHKYRDAAEIILHFINGEY